MTTERGLYSIISNIHAGYYTNKNTSSNFSILALVYILLMQKEVILNPLNAELNPICHLLALLGTQHILHVSRIRINTCPTVREFWQKSE